MSQDDQDDQLIVPGPLYDTQLAIEALNAMGLEYFEDYFDVPHSGGPVAEWCQIEFRMRS